MDHIARVLFQDFLVVLHVAHSLSANVHRAESLTNARLVSAHLHPVHPVHWPELVHDLLDGRHYRIHFLYSGDSHGNDLYCLGRVYAGSNYISYHDTTR